ncbi:MAG TPA: branched-chain amino acid ABC transporter substrate-binding protein [Candidatus Dormibacteraeota bacterium]|nr:branched-chain amino acid ABC transporter substrate-binding protein [Candidatus Dormibacteraeota bacterium]
MAISQHSAVEGYKLAYWSLDNALGAQHSQLRGRANVRRMIANPSVLGMVGPHSSFIAAVEMPEANLAHLAMVSPTTTGSCLTVAERPCSPTAASLRPSGSNNYFRITPRDPLQGRAMANYAATKLGLRRVAAFNEIGPEGSLYVDEFAKEFALHGGTLVYQQSYDDTPDNFSAFLMQARALGADAIYGVAGVDQNACKAAAQMNGLMPGAVFLATDSITLNDDCMADLGSSPPEVWATYGYVDPRTSTEPRIKKQVDDYRKVYSKPLDTGPYVFAAYDSTRILIDAIGRAIKANDGKLPSRAQVVAAVAQTKDFVGVTGTYSFDKNGDALSPMMTIYRVNQGRWEFVQVSRLGAS